MNTRDVKDFIAAGPLDDWTVYVGVPATKLPADPNKHIVVTPVGSGHLNTEMLYEDRFWQVRLRGPQARGDRDIQDAAVETEDAAMAVDRYLLGYDWPAYVAGTKVQFVNRAGAGPSPLGSGVQDGRSDYVATYYWDAATGL